eukprot:1175805-Prorocentrum_minimum.AAC.4
MVTLCVTQGVREACRRTCGQCEAERMQLKLVNPLEALPSNCSATSAKRHPGSLGDWHPSPGRVFLPRGRRMIAPSARHSNERLPLRKKAK